MEENEVNQPEFTEETQVEQNVEVDNQIETAEKVQTPFLKVKYNKEDKDLTADEAVEYAQKGMNYDHIKSELDTLKGSKQLKLLEKLAGESGMTTDEYVNYVEEQQELTHIQSMASQKGITDDTFAKEFYDLKKKADAWEKTQKENETRTQAETKKTQEYNEFFNFYKEKYGKDVVAEEIPKEVHELAKTMPIKNAFIQHEYERLLKGQAVEKKNIENAQTSTGSLSGQGSSQEITFTPENVANMTSKEMEKHWYNPLFRKVAGLAPLKR